MTAWGSALYVRPKPRPAPRGTMNGDERRYAEHLNRLKLAGELLDWKFDSLKLRLAENTFYTVDFFLTFTDRFECHEIKGFLRDDANVKFKVAAALYPGFVWKMLRWGKNTGFEVIREF
jgi:hypothetical protein